MTTSAVKEKRRPPLTTLATRLISTTRSLSSRSRSRSMTSRSTGVVLKTSVLLRGRPLRAPSRVRGTGNPRVRAEDDQAWPLRGPVDLSADALVTPGASFWLGQDGHYARLPTFLRTYS